MYAAVGPFTLAAGATREIPRRANSFAVLAATNFNTVAVSFDGASFDVLPAGMSLEMLPFDKVWVRNTGVVNNTITIGLSNGVIRDSRAFSTPTGGGNVPVTLFDGAGNPINLGQALMAASLPVAIASNQSNLPVVGAAADGAALAGNPVLIAGGDGVNAQTMLVDSGGRVIVSGSLSHDGAVGASTVHPVGGEARATERAAVASADACRLITDLVGKLITLPYANPENFVSGVSAQIVDTNDAQVIAAQAAGVRTYITSIVVMNDDATVGTIVEIKDGATIKMRIYVGPATATPGQNCIQVPLPVPLRGTAATAWNARCATTSAQVYVTMVGYTGV